MQLCKLCQKNESTEHGLVCSDCMKKSQYQAKANIALEDSDCYEWGVAKVTPGTINLIPEESEVVGTWHKYGNGIFWIHIETPIQALQDRATLLMAELAERRRQGLALMGPVKTSKPKTGASVNKARPTPIAEAPKTTGAEIVDAMQALRDKLRRRE